MGAAAAAADGMLRARAIALGKLHKTSKIGTLRTCSPRLPPFAVLGPSMDRDSCGCRRCMAGVRPSPAAAAFNIWTRRVTCRTHAHLKFDADGQLAYESQTYLALLDAQCSEMLPAAPYGGQWRHGC